MSTAEPAATDERAPSARGLERLLATDRRSLAVLAGAWLAVVALVGLGGDYPLNDDWAYAWSARHLLHTGELRILDWAAPSLVSHIAWGAALLRLFGESYVVLRAGTVAFGGLGLWALYALGRRAAFDPPRALVGALLLGLSPWYVNLSFTYMTDVPWLALMLCAILALASAERGQLGRIAVAGTLVGIAALARQTAVVTAPAFLLVVVLSTRREEKPTWKARALLRCIAFLLPLLVLYGAFDYWYSYLHGPTLAYRENWQDLKALPWWEHFLRIFAVWHYCGLWIVPLALATAWAGRLGRVLSRRQAAVAGLCLVGYAVFAWVGEVTDPRPALGANDHGLMPYLGNIVTRLGLGPPTLYDVYNGKAPPPHELTLLCLLLTGLSTLGGVVFGGYVITGVRRAWSSWQATRAGRCGPEQRLYDGGDARILLYGMSALYFLWQLIGPHLFDRYAMVLLPAAAWSALEGTPSRIALSPISLGLIAVMGIVSIGGTKEYLSWNAARDRAIRQLEAEGISSDDIDGGFEPNGERHFQSYFRRTGRLLPPGGRWWVETAPYQLSFTPLQAPDCTFVGQYPYWTWPGLGPRAIQVVHCTRAVH